MTSPPVLVVGSYPPVWTASTAATVQAVRDVWARDLEPLVVSPRLSAAHLTAGVDGVSAGLRLSALRRSSGAREIVLSTEAGFPVHAASRWGWLTPAAQWLTAAGLAWALAGFDRVTLVESGCPAGRSYGPGWGLVRARADRVRACPDARGRDGATPLGPSELDLRHRSRQVASLAARRLLGPYFIPVRIRAGTALRAGRRAVRGGKRVLRTGQRAVRRS